MNEVPEGCDALVIATEWRVKQLDLERARKVMTHPILFDGRNLFDVRKWNGSASFIKASGVNPSRSCRPDPFASPPQAGQPHARNVSAPRPSTSPPA